MPFYRLETQSRSCHVTVPLVAGKHMSQVRASNKRLLAAVNRRAAEYAEYAEARAEDAPPADAARSAALARFRVIRVIRG
jgi:hypothetical protein